jgi:hypothetical protein
MNGLPATVAQVPLQHVAPLVHLLADESADWVQVVVVVVELLVDVLVEDDEVVAIVVVVVDVVPLTHADAVPNDEAARQPGPHACPAAQQVRLAPLPHGVVPAGQPHRPWVVSMQATPV